MSYTANVDSNTLVLNISGEKMGVVIGKHGQTLDAIQHLVNIVVNNGKSSRVRIRIDSENYRDKRNKTLESLAKSVANNVRKTHKDYELEPMSSYERRIIHSVLQKERNIETTSVGLDKDRHVVVKYKR
jgi:spoIIIJ-associated protein